MPPPADETYETSSGDDAPPAEDMPPPAEDMPPADETSSGDDAPPAEDMPPTDETSSDPDATADEGQRRRLHLISVGKKNENDSGGDDGSNPAQVLASKTFELTRSVYYWDVSSDPDLDAKAAFVRARHMRARLVYVGKPKESDVRTDEEIDTYSSDEVPVAALSTAEIKVYAAPGSMDCVKGKSCIHGKCVNDRDGGRCVCDPDYSGPDCSTHLLIAHKYFPTTRSHGWWDNDKSDLFERERDSAEKSCSRFAYYDTLPGPAGLGAGLGSTLMMIAGDVHRGLHESRGYAFTGRINYAFSDYCDGRSKNGLLECYYKPTYDNKCKKQIQKKRDDFKMPQVADKNLKSAQCLLGERCGVMDAAAYKDVPKPFASKGLFWLRAHILGRMLQFSNRFGSDLNMQELKQSIGYEHPIIGLHIRHGDGCRYGIRSRLFDCPSVDDYLPDLRAMSEMYKTTRVYVATDSPAIVTSAKKKLGREFQLVFQQFDRSQLDTKDRIEARMYSQKQGRKLLATKLPKPMKVPKNFEFAIPNTMVHYKSLKMVSKSNSNSNRPKSRPRSRARSSSRRKGGGGGGGGKKPPPPPPMKKLDTHAVMRATVIDIDLLADADVYIGHLTSAMSRVALLVSSYRKQHIPPYVSMDGPFCPHWRVCCDVDAHGASSVC